MQSSGDEESPWVDDNDPPSHHAEAEWTSLSTNFTTAGYRDGISTGKEAALQEGFDAGFARTGAPRGHELGVLRGLATTLFLHLTRSSPGSAVELGQAQVQARVREIVGKLAAVRFADLVPPNEEATVLHEADPDALCATTNDSGSMKEVRGQSSFTDDLRPLRAQLETLLLESGLRACSVHGSLS